MHHLDDETLALRAASEPACFAALYERYAGDIQRFVASRVDADRAHVEDLTSRVFEKALIGVMSYRAGSFRGWLYRIARNVIIDDVRARRPVVSMAGVEHLSDGGRPLDADLEREMLHTALHEALATLTDEQRTILELRLKGLTAREIGARLGKDHEAVKSMQYRAMDRVRRHFLRTGQIRREDL